MTTSDLFTVIPDPPVKGEGFTVAYGFPDGVNSVEIDVDYEPDGPTTPHTLTRGEGPLSLTAQDGADSILITDKSGASLPYHEDLANS